MRNYQQSLLDPTQAAVIIIDHQPQMYFGVESHHRACILNNVTALAKAAQAFNVPCILTTVEAQMFSGYLAQKIQNVYPQSVPVDRTCINCWEDQNLKKAVTGTGKRKLLLAGLWTEACVTFPALSMREDGFEVFAVADACGGATKEAHDLAMQRMIQAGVVPVTWQQVMLEFQRDWNNKDTYNKVMAIVKEHSGAYGLGVEYSETMLPQAQKPPQPQVKLTKMQV
ncbi:MAG: hydrolase [Oscillospiraceae bacterium]|jgi:nicotinamidase-related amidase|nr:hydrolase [Oscillospiraceae bacterium]